MDGQTIIQKLTSVLSNPRDFFSEEPLIETFKYYFFVNVIGIVLGYFWMQASFTEYFNLVLRMIITFFISILFYHLAVYIVGGRGMSKTVQAYVYGSTPIVLVWWAPWLPFFAFIYVSYITIWGLQKLHGLTIKRAIWAYLIPLLCAAAVLIIPTIIWLA